MSTGTSVVLALATVALSDPLSDVFDAPDLRGLLLALSADDFFDLLANNIEIVKALFRYLVRELHHEPEAAS